MGVLTRILRMEGTDMKEAIQDDFRQWYMEYKRINGKFPAFPMEEEWQQPNFRFSIDNVGSIQKVEAEKPAKSKDKDKKKVFVFDIGE
jgi:hypothetical protein